MLLIIRFVIISALVLQPVLSVCSCHEMLLPNMDVLDAGVSPINQGLSDLSSLPIKIVNKVIFETGLSGKIPVKNNTNNRENKNSNQHKDIILISSSETGSIKRVFTSFVKNLVCSGTDVSCSRNILFCPKLLRLNCQRFVSVFSINDCLRMMFSARDSLASITFINTKTFITPGSR